MRHAVWLWMSFAPVNLLSFWRHSRVSAIEIARIRRRVCVTSWTRVYSGICMCLTVPILLRLNSSSELSEQTMKPTNERTTFRVARRIVKWPPLSPPFPPPLSVLCSREGNWRRKLCGYFISHRLPLDARYRTAERTLISRYICVYVYAHFPVYKALAARRR